MGIPWGILLATGKEGPKEVDNFVTKSEDHDINYIARRNIMMGHQC